MVLKTTFTRGLNQLLSIVEKTPPSILDSRLSPDMFDMKTQCIIACNMARRGYLPLVGKDVETMDGDVENKEALLSSIKCCHHQLSSLADVHSLDSSIYVTDMAGQSSVTLSQPDFIHQFILPNFYFHIAMAYATARHNGVALSKGDFDGIHQYATGFSFV